MLIHLLIYETNNFPTVLQESCSLTPCVGVDILEMSLVSELNHTLLHPTGLTVTYMFQRPINQTPALAFKSQKNMFKYCICKQLKARVVRWADVYAKYMSENVFK